MIKANELRIGNWVNVPNLKNYTGPKYGQVTSISDIGINSWQDMGASGIDKFDNIFPIPLTPVILLNAGFRQNGAFWASIEIGINLLHVSVHHKKYTISSAGNDDELSFDNVQSLHQLQNLYFALTGEELIVML